jgi:hypothetical protein
MLLTPLLDWWIHQADMKFSPKDLPSQIPTLARLGPGGLGWILFQILKPWGLEITRIAQLRESSMYSQTTPLAIPKSYILITYTIWAIRKSKKLLLSLKHMGVRDHSTQVSKRKFNCKIRCNCQQASG